MRNIELTEKQEAYITENCKSVDVERAYDELLDDCYSFDSVGGPFASMLPSRVLREADQIAYRCGLNDWLDVEDYVEIDGDYYNGEDVDDAIQEMEDSEEEGE